MPCTDRLHSAWKGWCIPNMSRNSSLAGHKAAGLDSGLSLSRSDCELHRSDKGFHRRNNPPKPGLENQPSQVIQILAWVQIEYFLSFAICLFCDLWQMSWHLCLQRLCQPVMMLESENSLIVNQWTPAPSVHPYKIYSKCTA